ncbi:MAG: preprotein translocase subunit YajC [Candidatus Krumholzibacteria bacterium]|nr:preprotein translocase subunit YajC [Candidatus Krumholzibacteria bacterium]MDP6669644.1 preprotein translocase subunit YajC [Candidatus Krumholzibacteria bacterium]MDP7021070.1 preprotein translocase subunit YajC [Candidatus Krumholzibacteria bacterium]
MSFFLQTAAPAPMMGNFLFLGLMFAVFFFLIIRPQQKRAKEHRALLEGLSRGDKVMTSGGIFGTVDSVKDNVVVLKISENTKIEILKDNVSAKTS